MSRFKMDVYKPNSQPDSTEWLALSEDERLDMVVKYHCTAKTEEERRTIHATVHVLVENQLALNVDYVPATLAKLMRQGLDRHESVHAIGAVLMGDVHRLLQTEDEKWDMKNYRRKLEKLTAKRWQKGQF